MKNTIPVLIVVLTLSIPTGSLAADEASSSRWGPYFLGYETEPCMDYGGRMITTLHRGIGDFGWMWTSRRMPYVSAAYELPLAVFISTVQHEVFGHGSRAREYNLNPEYGFGLDFSAYTTINKDPENNLQMATLSAGGTEADSVMAHRILIDLCQSTDGAPACSIPLMFLGKMDISVYVFSTSKPEPKGSGDDNGSGSFVDDYESGNDIALYLVTRQAQRKGAKAGDVWNRDYVIDFNEPELKKTYDHMQSAATWNLLDPMMWSAMVLYVKEHLVQGKRMISPPALPLGAEAALTVGTRAAMSPDCVTRFLDLYLVTGLGVLNVYGRDLQSTEETTMGFGGGIYGLRLGPVVKLTVAGDYWKNPAAPEEFYRDAAGWNVSSELEIAFGGPVSAAFKIGDKSEGFFPGVPTDSGLYGGAGLSLTF